MAQVYLPLGYPLVSGEGFANILYQGNLVRLYQIPNDPRSDAQLENRRLLSDVSKMRATLGLWARGACKAAFGSRWSSVLWQVIRTDIESFWSDAVDEWAGFWEGNKDAWRVAAPYQATFNDVGLIYFAMVRTLARAFVHYNGLEWQTQLWGEYESAEATTWWTRGIAGNALAAGTVYQQSIQVIKTAGWQVLTDPNPPGWQYLRSTSAGERVGVYMNGRTWVYGYKLLGDYGEVDIFVDNQLFTTFQLVDYNNMYGLEFPYRGLHYLEVYVKTPNVTFDFFTAG